MRSRDWYAIELRADEVLVALHQHARDRGRVGVLPVDRVSIDVFRVVRFDGVVGLRSGG